MSSPRRRSRRTRLTVPLLVCALLATGSLTAALPPTQAAGASAAEVRPARAAAQNCPDEGHAAAPDWALTSTDPKNDHHAYAANGYLGQSLPPAGTGYSVSERETGWPLKTPRYDGAFVSGLYAHNARTAGNRHVVAALPTWSGLTVGAGRETFDASVPTDRISAYRQTVFLRCGLVRTSLTWTTGDGRATDLVYDVVADRRYRHVGAVRLRMTPHWRGTATVTDLLDGRGARRISATANGPGGSEDDRIAVPFRTDGTDVDGAVVSTLRPDAGVPVRDRVRGGEGLTAHQSVSVPVRAGRTYAFTKFVGIDTELTSREPARSAADESRRAADRGWDRLFGRHAAEWEQLWSGDIRVNGRPELQKWLRSSLYGLLANIRAGSPDSIAPAGLTSDDYAGLKFWDAETWMFPGLLAFRPELAEPVLEYRYRTMPAARQNAAALGHRGLFYPWTSADKGDLDSECHSVEPDHCRTQIHLQADIALAAWQFYQQTGDRDWLRNRGWPLLKGIAEFWESRVTRNGDGSYSINNVSGPDEYSNHKNDAVFTNAAAATALRNATRAAGVLGERAPASWTTIADRLRILYDERTKVFQQFDGYDGRAIKQADAVLLIYPLEWPMSDEAAANTLDHYAARSDPDGPAMTDSVHAVVAAAVGKPGCATHTYLTRSVRPFVRGPFALFSEARGERAAGAGDPHAGFPAEDFLTGKGGFVQVFTHGLTGLRTRSGKVHLDPMLPPQLSDGVTLSGLRAQGRTYEVAIGPEETTVRLTQGEPLELQTPQGSQVVSAAAPAVLKTRRPDLEPTGNLARCRPAEATSEQSGLYADAAVDGDGTTYWSPDAAEAHLTVDLGRTARVSQVLLEWSKVRPDTYRLLASVDGRSWREVTPGVSARFVRAEVRAADPSDEEKRPGIAELKVMGEN
ncbi:discoidin domain-containing protein [Streptomyces sp. TRM70350]|uniref:discoidin domain-containing protein n=1 Tax=Streptomyces sp. TRM70350 TaxID=2856165 RepID=UPI001C46CDEB|nr:discoidin domain-containing protein [Streptomyces sp. TRM70350]MBV7695877.1 discoidin domain-containing protein [Streptomyces sp. TRM70350]